MEKFRVEKNEYVSKTIRVPSGLFSETDHLSRQKGIPFNQLVIQCCRYAMSHLADDEGGRA